MQLAESFYKYAQKPMCFSRIYLRRLRNSLYP